MTFASILIWAIIGFIWMVLGEMHVTDNGQIGLIWLAVLSALSALSYLTVRTNDKPLIGRQPQGSAVLSGSHRVRNGRQREINRGGESLHEVGVFWVSAEIYL